MVLNELSKNLWSILKLAQPNEWESGSALRRALRELAEKHRLGGVALEVHGSSTAPGPASREWRRVVEVGALQSERQLEIGLTSAARLLIDAGTDEIAAQVQAVDGDAEEQIAGINRNLGVALAAGAQLVDLAQRLKTQSFQDNYRVVTMEALYDVGLAIASTLNLDELTDGILLRAVSLLDARRGALFLLKDGSYRLEGTIGGDALDALAADDGRLSQLQSAEATECDDFGDLLPGATHCLVVPIAVDGEPLGLLALADKESRTGIGPFASDDGRALALFANQAAIALENANLHRQALEKERLEREMELAADIQRGILPSDTPDLEDFELLGWNRPTRQVGGDYYGWVAMEGGRTGIVVADVTGKGMPAALLVNTLHSALHLLLDAVEPGAEMIERLNNHVAESSRSNKFITMIMIILVPGSARVGLINAGHNPGVLIRADGSVEELEASGLPLGLLPGSTYRVDELELGEGDLICMYSDGITEREGREDEEYGMERLVAFLTEHRRQPLREVLEGLEEEVSRFGAGRMQQDDQTVVLVRRR